jgi:hypothetical protein
MIVLVVPVKQKTDRFNPDKIWTTEISSRLNKGNKDLTGQVGQADPHRFTRLNKISFYEIRF